MVFDKQIKNNAIGAALSLSSTGFLIPSFLLNGLNVVNVTGAVVAVGASIYALSKAIGMKIVDNEIIEMMESDQYKEYASLYHEYVNDISKMFSDLGFKGDLSVCVGYIFCLGNGIFSENQEYKYTIYDTDLDFFYDTMGARVATGKCCCRHNVSLLSDIINEMGGKAACLPVCSSHSDEIKKHVKASHLVVGVNHDGKKVVFDPTVDFRGVPTESISLFVDNASGVVSNTLDSEVYHHLRKHVGYDSYDDNNKLKEEVLALESLNDISKVSDVYIDNCIKATYNYNDFVDFNREMQPKIKKLSLLNKSLVFHENKKTT